MGFHFINNLVSWAMKKRFHQIEFFIKYPHEVQQDLLHSLIQQATNTEFGLTHSFKNITSYENFQQQVPIRKYEDFSNWIERNRQGEQNLLWHSKIKWFAMSSGTSNDVSKFIPISSECLNECHFKAGKDLLSIYCNNNPNTKIFTGKSLKLGGSYSKYGKNDTYFGDLSAIMIKNLPIWVDFMSAPSSEIASVSNWEERVERILETCRSENITSLAGVPSWMMGLIKEIVEKEKITTILDLWPNLEMFIHGGVNFTPYRSQYRELIPKSNFNYYEVYNASEGFFAIQDQNQSKDMLLMLDYGIFFEFIPMEEFDETNLAHNKTIPLHEVELEKNYAMVISTNTGLWRYLIGDTVRFKSLAPYRIRVSGRTKNFINAFGEELMIHNAEEAIAYACEQTNSQIEEFTVAPIYMTKNDAGAHEWAIEFRKKPSDLAKFKFILDQKLQELNSDYQAKRYQNTTMRMPEVLSLPKNSFYKWMESKNKLGGQNKVPRLKNDRSIVESLLSSIEAVSS